MKNPRSAAPRILVAEDDVFIAMGLEDLLVRHGYVVLGPVPSLVRAKALLDEGMPDAALLDLNLNGEISTPLAGLLAEGGVPFAILSGYSEDRLGEPVLQGAPFVAKPCSDEDVLQRLRELLEEPKPG